jgi:glycine betaine/proline transport system ATP-binding protein
MTVAPLVERPLASDAPERVLAGGSRRVSDLGGEKARITHLTKIFGKTPDRALELMRAGRSKADILSETGNVVALQDVSLSVREGEIFVVMGLSGSGKSTLVRCFNRLVVPTAGEVLIDGRDVTRLSTQELRELRRNRVSMVFQHFALFPHKTVAENVAFGLKVNGVDKGAREDRAHEVLSLVGLGGWERRYPHSLSGGMQQRVGLARALASDPDIILMDEPFSALDPLIRREMHEQLCELLQRVRKTLVFITHDLAEAVRLGDRVAIMRDGEIVQIGSPEQIIAAPADPYVAQFVEDVDRGRVLRLDAIMRAAVTMPPSAPVEATAGMLEAAEVGFVVDEDGRPLGAVGPRELANAARDRGGQVADVMSPEFVRTRAGATLTDVYNDCAYGRPVAVVDEHDRVVGTLDAQDVMRGLGKPGA